MQAANINALAAGIRELSWMYEKEPHYFDLITMGSLKTAAEDLEAK